jgi:hypothetical protein
VVVCGRVGGGKVVRGYADMMSGVEWYFLDCVVRLAPILSC